LLIDRENLVGGDKVEDGENGIETVNYAGFFFINYADRSAETFAEDNKVEDGENGVEIIDCAGFFFINYISRGAEDFAGNGEDDVGIVDCEEFFINYADRCAVSLYSANLIIVIAAVKTANIYRFWIYRINSGSSFNNYF
jgi:hypothetical protein